MNSKILGLRDWFDLRDAALLVGDAFKENVNSIDVLRLALDGHLKLSVNLINGAYGRLCKKVRPGDIEWKEVPSLDGGDMLRLPKTGHTINLDYEIYHVDGEIFRLERVLDLPMLGNERTDVEYQFHLLQFQPTPTAVALGAVLVQSECGDLYELHDRVSDRFDDRKNFHPSGALPQDHTLIVRRVNLDAFIKQHAHLPSKDEAVISPRERTSLLNIIATLLAVNGEKEMGLIDQIVQKFPGKPGISKRNLEKKFAEAKRMLLSS